MNTGWFIRLLGGLHAERAGADLVRFQTRKTGGLLAYLAYHLNQNHSRDTLIEHIWPELDCDGARACLSTALHSLRRQLESPDVLGASVILATRTDVRLNPMAVATDVGEFIRILRSIKQEADEDARMGKLIRALALYRGELLPGCGEDWVSVERERLAIAFLRANNQLVAILERRAELDRALEFALRGVAAAPNQEGAHHNVIRIQRLLNHNEEAAQQYQRLVVMLRKVWEREPSESTKNLAAGLNAGRQPRGAAAKTCLRAPDAAAPAIGAAPAPGSGRPDSSSRLPLVITRFFGREPEIARLCEDLQPKSADASAKTTNPESLVTLTGTGGSGKTRLALEVMKELYRSYDSRVLFVSLANVSNPENVSEAVHEATGLARHPGKCPLEQVIEHFSGRPALIVFDNAEQVKSACAETARELLTRLPLLTCLCTSRIPLDVPGERIFPVQPLPVPTKPGTPSRLIEFACVQMFIDRARAVVPDFQITPGNADAIAAVCQRLEGLPLAIELAAARSSALAPRQILDELSRRFDFLVNRKNNTEKRHNTLHAAIEWSYRLLPEPAQAFFRSLSVFRGGWTLEAARAVSEDAKALDYLEELVERSLISAEERNGAMRYRMLESLREFAALSRAPEESEAVLLRHADFYLKLVEEKEPLLRTASLQPAADELDVEIDNLRAVLEKFAGQSLGIRIAGALWRFWSARGHAAEGKQWLQQALAGAPEQPSPATVKAEIGLAAMHHHIGEYREAERAAEEGLYLARKMNFVSGVADALNLIAVLADEQGDRSRARRINEECLELRKSLEDRWGIAATLNNLGGIAHREGDLDRAAALYRQSYAIYKELKDWARTALTLSNLGLVAYDQLDYAIARASFEQSLTLMTKLGNLWAEAVLHYNLGETLYRESNHREAHPHLLESVRVRMELGDRSGVPPVLIALGNIAGKEGKHIRAVRLFAAGSVLGDSMDTPIRPISQRMFDQDLELLKSAMDARDFRAAWNFGRGMTLEEAVEYASEESRDAAPGWVEMPNHSLIVAA